MALSIEYRGLPRICYGYWLSAARDSGHLSRQLRGCRLFTASTSLPWLGGDVLWGLPTRCSTAVLHLRMLRADSCQHPPFHHLSGAHYSIQMRRLISGLRLRGAAIEKTSRDHCELSAITSGQFRREC